ncbi:hypothetical protein [Candidatus Mycolicibacterium alkanivorans]|uniref:hypothetical protein n=1 Tax=Candidatus Mycolicibacterium alkanivorans TaxID=2954114 RepID=UPI003556AA4F
MPDKLNEFEAALPVVRIFFTGIKEDLRHFWSYKRRGSGRAAKHFKRSRLKPIIEAAKTLKRHEAQGCCPTSPTRSPTPVLKA